MNPIRRSALTASCVAGLLAGCAARPGSAGAWTAVPEPGPTGPRRDQLEVAVAARDDLFAELMATLSGELAESGPAAAIAVCRDAAPSIAREVSRRHGVRIGRTSWKLRNPDNAPPEWADALLEERPDEPRFAAGPDGELGAALPIRVMQRCLVCHGGRDDVPADVRAALDRLYPDDRATGFRTGDLRGWFWVEVPAEQGESR